MDQLQQAIIWMLKTKEKYDKAEWADERVLWVEMDEQDWKMIRRMFQVIQQHQIWIEKDNTETVQALATNRERDWREILLDGKLPGASRKITFSAYLHKNIRQCSQKKKAWSDQLASSSLILSTTP
jgi:hypothetical protein